MDKVSIIIPTYNRSLLLEETILSVINQDYQNWELLIVDDYSTDDTQDLVESYIQKDERIKLLKNTRTKGAQGARNTGILAAQSKYIILLDSDDLLSPNCLSKRVSFIQKQSDLDFFAFPTAIFKKKPGDTPLLWNYLHRDDDLLRFLRQDMPFHTCGVIWKKEALIELGLMDEALPCWQEWDIYVRALISDFSYAKSPDKINFIDSYFRSHDGESISKHTKKETHLVAISHLILKTAEALNGKGLLKKEEVSHELAKLGARHTFQMMVHHQQYQEGIIFFKKLLSFISVSGFTKKAWTFYLHYRFNQHYPLVLRKLLDWIKIFGKTYQLFYVRSTFAQAQYDK